MQTLDGLLKPGDLKDILAKLLKLNAIKDKILKLNKDKQFDDSLKYFEENKSGFTNEEIRGNDYLVSGLLTAFRKANKINRAFDFLDFYKIEINNSTKENVLVAYGWLLYSKFKSENEHRQDLQNETDIFDEDEIIEEGTKFHLHESELIKNIKTYIPLILKFDTEYSYNVFSKIFTTVLKAEKRKQNANWKFINDFCDLIVPERLKTECPTIEVVKKGRKKEMELASDKENWYAYKSKALMKLGKFQDCYNISKTALETFQNFHYSNDVWFARRIALSKKNLGNLADAISDLNQILLKKREWFIQKELAELYKEKGDNENAFKFAIQAVNNFGDLEYKVDLLFLLGELLMAKQENDLAFKHFSLCRLIRINKEWKIPSKLSSALEKFEKENIPFDKLQELKSELKKYWSSFNTQQQTGKIDKILNNNEKGTDGFIKTFDGKSYYFRVNPTDEIKSKIKIGLEVKFEILPAIEGKKERAISLKINKC